MRGPPVYGCLVEETVIVVAQGLEAVQAVAPAQALAVADLLDDLKPCTDAPVATGAVGEEADLDLSVAAAVHFVLIQHFVAGPVDDPGATVCVGVGVDEPAACVVLVVLLLVTVTQGLFQLGRQLATPLCQGCGVGLDGLDGLADGGQGVGVALLNEQAQLYLGSPVPFTCLGSQMLA